MRAAGAAGGKGAAVEPELGTADMILGIVRLAYEKLKSGKQLNATERALIKAETGQEPVEAKGQATQAYEGARDESRQQIETAKEQYPGSYLGAEIGGAVLSPFSKAGAVAKGANVFQRAHNVGKAGFRYGVAAGAGEGEGLEGTIKGAAIGGPVGYVAGAALNPAVEGAGKAIGFAGRRLNQAIGSPFSTLAQKFNPEGVAGRAAATLERNAQQSGDKTAISRAEYERRLAAGDPVMPIDMMGDQGRNLARNIKNEPGAQEGRQALQESTQGRFLDENKRIANDVRQFSVGNRRVSTDDLLDAAAPSNAANYKAAHAQGKEVTDADFAQKGMKSQGLLTPGMRSLLQTDTAQKALKRAAESEHDRTIIEGVTKGVTQRGRKFPLEVEKTEAGGVRIKIREYASGNKENFDLHAVDAVSRALRDFQTRAVSSGDREFAREVTILRKAWLAEADKQVPLYAKARGEAMKAFKVRGFGDEIENSYQAGQAYVGKMGVRGNIGQNDLAKMEAIIKQMSPAEKELFRRGAGDHFAYLLEKIPENRAVWSQILASTGAIHQMEVAFGKPFTRRLIARRDVEKIMDFSRTAVMGNSTTALQQNLTAAGLGTLVGAGGGIASGNDPIKAGSIWGALALAYKPVQRQVSAKVFDNIGKMITSGSPAQYEAAMKQVVNNEKLFNAVRQLAQQIERGGAGTAGGESAPQIAQRVPLMIGRAGEEAQPVR